VAVSVAISFRQIVSLSPASARGKLLITILAEADEEQLFASETVTV
jgi:hypothetical protein